ncbi:MAG: bifunctional UDP-N-acetylglucosamine diphosphorylase/glucosamine-1-phosphate N-acetyltransferase GlmU, partial [Elusimicrobia bacterium]|nr:bifunctional UDP-N-acetylglucosamine diphosphorylase/glucosamine-1-phosphate N-acetyltransferase GlmU [Elusimicrobiota bacterium]
VPRPEGYGRLIRGKDGHIERIMEEGDASVPERGVREVNVGVWCFATSDLLKVLPRLHPNNVKREYYLTDCVHLLRRAGCEVQDVACTAPEEALGVNTQQELSQAEAILRQRVLVQLMEAGVTVTAPSLTFVDAGVMIAADTVLWPGTIVLGRSQIGRRCQLGPNALIQDSILGDGVEVRASFLYGTRVGNGARIGPFAHLRTGSWVAHGARVGNFVELKCTSGRAQRSAISPTSGIARWGHSSTSGLGSSRAISMAFANRGP